MPWEVGFNTIIIFQKLCRDWNFLIPLPHECMHQGTKMKMPWYYYVDSSINHYWIAVISHLVLSWALLYAKGICLLHGVTPATPTYFLVQTLQCIGVVLWNWLYTWGVTMEVVVVISCSHVLIKDERFLLWYIMNAIYCIILKHCDNIAIIEEEKTL